MAIAGYFDEWLGPAEDWAHKLQLREEGARTGSWFGSSVGHSGLAAAPSMLAWSDCSVISLIESYCRQLTFAEMGPLRVDLWGLRSRHSAPRMQQITLFSTATRRIMSSIRAALIASDK